MSASTQGGPTPGGTGQPAAGEAAGGDPSMEDILASIRRILSEDEPAPAQFPATPPAEPEVLALQESMIVVEPAEPAVPPAPIGVSTPPPGPAPRVRGPEYLVAPEAEAAAASSVGALLRTLVAGREQVHVYRGGPTIEDLVREEVRPLLKTWLDTNLPPIVERLVRAEIERVVGRAIP